MVIKYKLNQNPPILQWNLYYNGHLWNLKSWLLDTDGRLIQDHYKILTESGLNVNFNFNTKTLHANT